MVTKTKKKPAKKVSDLGDFSRAIAESAERDRLEDEARAKQILDDLPAFKHDLPSLSNEDLLALYLQHRGQTGSVWNPQQALAYAQLVEVEHAEILRRMGSK